MHELKTYGFGGVVLEARFYSFNELRDILKAEEILNEHLKKSMGELKDFVGGHQKMKKMDDTEEE